MRIIIYTETVSIASGVSTFEKNFVEKFKDEYEIDYYSKYDLTNNKEIKSYGGQLLDCDLCIYSSAEHMNVNIRAKYYIQMVHCNWKKWDVKPTYNNSIDLFVCPSEHIKKALIEDFNVPESSTLVISNILSDKKVFKKVVRFATVSRIQEGKGFDRMFKMITELRNANIDFIWEIYGDGKKEIIDQFSNYKEIYYAGRVIDPIRYIKNVDFLVQLSDDESFCYSVYEALQNQIPCIITNWPGSEKTVVTGRSGIILNMDLSDLYLYLEKIVNFQKKKGFNNNDESYIWVRLFNTITNEKN